MPRPKVATESLRSFFETFTSLNARTDTEGLAALYAPAVMIAGPNGAHVVTTADLLRAIPRRRELFDAAGRQSTSLVGFEQTDLSDRYSFVRADWRWEFARAARPSAITLTSSFLVDRFGDAPHIVVYVMHQDPGAVMREHGLLPPAS
jgi:hypothetical protein